MRRSLIPAALAMALAATLAACGGSGASSAVPASAVALATPGPIAFIGDSITAGTMLPDDPNGKTDPHAQSPTAYPFLIGKLLGVQVSNLGIGGELIGQAVKDEVPEIQPDTATVVIYLGTNNITFGNPTTPIVANAESQYAALLNAVRARVPLACIVLVGLPHGVWSKAMWPYQDQFDTYLASLKLPMLDLRTQNWTTVPTNFIYDGIHPDVQGNADLAASVEEELLVARCL